MENGLDLEQMNKAAEQASALLKALANKERLLVLCNLAAGEKCVSELQAILQVRQPTLSQQLARLRADSLVETRRAGKEIYYSLCSDAAGKLIETLYGIYCAPKAKSHAAITKKKEAA